MRPYTQAFNDAIRSTDREMKGYIQFNGDQILDGDGGLISFKVNQIIMDEERFCIGSCVSCYCQASFFNSGIPSGVSLPNSYFDVYAGVKVGADITIAAEQTVEFLFDHPQITGVDFNNAVEGAPVKAIINGQTLYGGAYRHSNTSYSFTDGTLHYEIFSGNGSWWFYATAYDGITEVPGEYTIALFSEQNEYKVMGRFYISEVSRGKETTTVTGYDVISKTNIEYKPTVVKTSNGYQIFDIFNDIIDQTGINNGVHFSSLGKNQYIPEIVEGTCRQQLGWLYCFVYGADRPGACLYGSLGTLGNTATRDYVNNAEHYDTYPALDDTVIYLDGLTIGDEDFTIDSLTTGTQENPIVVGSGVGINNQNPYITQAQAQTIYNALHGVTYRPMRVRFRGDPCITVFDSLKVTQDGTDYRCIPMQITSTFNGGFEQTIDCWGDSEAYYEMSYSPMEAKIQTTSNMLSEIAQSIETANNGVITKVLDADGSWKELVIANSVDLSSATSVWRWNINGLSHSNRYTGGTYTFAMDDQGRIVANVIQTGVLQDALGKNSWNLDTGAFTITDGSVNITTATDSTDAIELNYGTAKIRLNPSRLDLSNTNGLFGNYAIVLRSDMGMIGVYDAVNTSTTFFNMTAHTGTLTLRGATSPGAIDLKDTNNNNTVILSGGNGFGGISKVGLVMGDGTHRLTDLDNTGLTFYDSSGTQTASYPANGMPSYDTGTVPCAVSTGWTLAGELTIQEDGVYAIYGLQNYNNAQPVATAIAGYNGTYEYSLASNTDMERHGGIIVAHLNASCIEACWVGYKLRLYVKANQSATNNCRLYARKLA